MTFEEYIERERPRYALLARIVESILRAAVKMQPSLRLQHTQRRAKERDSLEKKLQRDGNRDTENLEGAVKDLAGCRLVFYTNADVSTFLSSGVVQENFEIDWDRTKIHHPSQAAASAADLFVSNNYVVRLKPDRAGLPEYAGVSGLWCEVQVQTTLNHAWAEMAHDTIYKKPELPGGFGGNLMNSIEERMANIMRDHLLPAGHEFQKVLTDFERLSSGKELFDRGALEALAECDDNNSLYDLIERFSTYVLPNYDDLSSIYPDILKSLIKGVECARAAESKPIKTPFGSFPGYTSEDICEKAADIIDQLRYADVSGTFYAIVDLFIGAKSDKEAQRWITSGEHLAENNLFIWKRAGPTVQQTIVSSIAKLETEKKDRSRPLMTAMLAKILSPEATGTSGSFDRVTFSRGTVPSSESLRKVRSEAIKQLKLFFVTSPSGAERRRVGGALHGATRVGTSTGLSDRLRATVLDDSRDIVEFYTGIFDRIDHQLLQHIEHELLWLYRHNPPTEPPEGAAAEVEEAREGLRNAIIAFRDQINKDRSFQIYKTLVGYESVFAPAWEDERFDIEAIDKYRSDRIDELVDGVSDANEDEWLETLNRCASTESNDLATFPSLGMFLERLARKNPGIVLGYLSRIDERLAGFLPSMLVGLQSGPLIEEANDLLRRWVDEGKFLSQIIWSFRAVEKLDIELLRKTLDQAIQNDERSAVFNIVTVADRRNEDVDGGLVDSLLLPAISYLSSVGDARWPNAVWGTRGQSLFKSLNSEQAEYILKALVMSARLDWREEQILSAIAGDHPGLVIEFFGDRLAAASKVGADYDPIPFQFYDLHEGLSAHPSEVIGAARRWYAADPRHFAYRGGRFVSNIFKTLTPDAEAELRDWITRGEEGDIEFVVQVLRSYEGEEFLHGLLKEIVQSLPTDSDLLNEVELALDESGVVAGEFGYVELFRTRLKQMRSWMDDPRDRVRAFAERHSRSLERRIAAEQRRAEESLEARKREWGSEDPDDEGNEA
jgi:ppGpp synthetase/RelA/SpoT-type nucleotidyltranferase